jgi:drug/metabolite transporter (DMT)-like permease
MHVKGLLLVGFGVLVLSPDALLIRLVGLGAPAILFWQGLALTAGFFGLLVVMYRGQAVARMASMGRWGVVIGVFSGLNQVFFVVSVTHTAVANTLVILAASPVFAAVFSRIFLHERISPWTWAACLVIVAGVGAILRADLSSTNVTGDLAALGGSLSTSTMLVVLRSRRGSDPIPGMTLGGLLTSLGTLPFVRTFSITEHQISLFLLLGLVVLPVSLGLITRGPAYLSAPEVGLVTLLETVLGPLWVWMWLDNRPSSITMISGGIIVVVVAAHSVQGLRAEPDDGPEVRLRPGGGTGHG